MVIFFVGTPGSGKSYEAVRKIIDNLRLGRIVCTNIDGMDHPEHQEYIKNYLGWDDYKIRTRLRILTKDEVTRFWESETIINTTCTADDEGFFQDCHVETEELICPKGSLIVIDEAHKFFNSRDWQKNPGNQLMADWASTHRHNGYDLILITQSIDKVEKQVRSLTEWTYFFRKVNFFGGAVTKKYLQYAYSGDDHDGKPLSKQTKTYDPSIFPCYKSYASADAKEVAFMSHVNILKHPIFFAIPAVIGLCLYMFFVKSSFATGDIFGVNKTKQVFNDRLAAQNKAAAQKKVGLLPVALASGSVPAAPAGSPVFSPVSSSRSVNSAPVVWPVLNPVPSEYSRYIVQGSISCGDRTYILINGISVRLPSPVVRSYNKHTGVVWALTSEFGSHTEKPSVPST